VIAVSEQGIITGAMKIIEEKTCIKFKKYTDEKHWLYIKKSDGCYSSVGRDYKKSGMQSMSLGPECLQTSIVLHELLHSLGFWHEQSRPDRDQYVEIFWENIKQGEEYNFEKYTHQEADTLGFPYDYNSIMHYARTSGSKNGKATIIAIGQKDLALGNSKTLTSTDILQINMLYECNKANDTKSYISSWTVFGPCNSACTKKRQRFCANADLSVCPRVNANGVEEEVVPCTDQECYAPINGHWGRWTSWGDCIPDCGPRNRSRTRKCNNPEPKYGGKPCQGASDANMSCSPKSCAIQCDFDKDWCGWTNSHTNTYRFNWLRVTGKTFSVNTGPSKDHTKGNGSYLAVEASSPALLGDKARIISWQREGAVSGECIGFWYHMYGVHIGALRVILKFEGGDEEEVWKMSGNKGDVWIYGNATIYSSNPYQVVFEAERGNGYQGDIAIDDVGVTPGYCGMTLTGSVERLAPKPVESIGCFRDSYYSRDLPELIESQRHTIDWLRYESSLARIVQSCSEKAKLKGYTYIGIQYYGECWSGPNSTKIFNHGPSTDCVNGLFRACTGRSDDFCTGKSWANYIYRVL